MSFQIPQKPSIFGVLTLKRKTKWQRKKNGKRNRNRIQYRSARKNKEVLKAYLTTYNALFEIIDKSGLKRKKEAIKLLKELKAHLNELIKQVFNDQIKVKDPLALIEGLKQMKHDKVFSFKSSEMARILILACVFNSEILINPRTLSDFLNDK